jgi:hypothetical protein
MLHTASPLNGLARESKSQRINGIDRINRIADTTASGSVNLKTDGKRRCVARSLDIGLKSWALAAPFSAGKPVYSKHD